MSSYWAGGHGVALMLTMEEAKKIVKRHMNHFPNDDVTEFLEKNGIECNFEEFEFTNIRGENPFKMTYISTDYCDGMCFIPFRLFDGSDNIGECKRDAIYFWRTKDTVAIFADHNMECMEAILDPPYKSYEDLLNEFKGKLEGLVPDDFNWYDRIGSLSFAAYA